jgi:hypothetical protein
VLRIWKAYGLQPHLVSSFKLSTDPLFVEKVRDIVGLYLNPREKAIGLCVDEKKPGPSPGAHAAHSPFASGIAGSADPRLDTAREQLPCLRPHDAASGKFIGRCNNSHRHQEFLHFLGTSGGQHASTQDLGRPLDYGQLRDPQGGQGQTMIFFGIPATRSISPPRESSWTNLMERLFSRITGEAIRRNSFTSLKQLRAAIDAYVQEHITGALIAPEKRRSG